MTFLRYFCTIAFFACLAGVSPALSARMYVSIETEFTLGSNGVAPEAMTGVATFVKGLPDLMRGDLANAVKDPDCNADVVAWGRDRDEIKKELELQKSRYATPETRAHARKIKLIEPNTMVSGSVVATPDSFEVTLTAKTYPGGKEISKVTTKWPRDKAFDSEDAMIKQLGKELCAKKSFNIKGALGPLKYHEKICDIRRPFTFTAKGSYGALTITLTPAGAEANSGSVSGGGTVAYAQWKGSGSYTQSIQGDTGKIDMTITFGGTVAGHATATTTEDYPATLTALKTCVDKS